MTKETLIENIRTIVNSGLQEQSQNEFTDVSEAMVYKIYSLILEYLLDINNETAKTRTQEDETSSF